MQVERIEAKFTNLDIAEIQLVRAIDLFFQEDFISAITLAGAAEEILGKLLNKKGRDHWLDTTSKGALRSLGFTKNDMHTTQAKKTKKEIADLVNFHKNRLKHLNDSKTLTFLIDVEASSMIDRAISNYFKLTKKHHDCMVDFREIIIWDDNN